MARILLVDDEPDIVFTTRMMLEKDGHQVSVAKNSEECMKMLENDLPDLILLDIMMPGENGWETCRKVKGDEKTKDVPVVMFTVRSGGDSIKKSREYSHADAHINKPFKRVELLDTVRKLLKEKT
ncbi:MAG: response regulator [Candidatus Hydrothermarchaeales archaeon]